MFKPTNPLSLSSSLCLPVPCVGPLGLRNGVIVDVDDLIEVSHDNTRHGLQLLEVEGRFARLVRAHEAGKSDGGEVTHCNLKIGGKKTSLQRGVVI